MRRRPSSRVSGTTIRRPLSSSVMHRYYAAGQPFRRSAASLGPSLAELCTGQKHVKSTGHHLLDEAVCPFSHDLSARNAAETNYESTTLTGVKISHPVS